VNMNIPFILDDLFPGLLIIPSSNIEVPNISITISAIDSIS
jgi:hypothetical protein